MQYTMRIVGDHDQVIPVEVDDLRTGPLRLERVPELALDRNLTIDTKWIDFAINCAASVPISILANALYDHVFKRQGNLIEKDETEIHIQSPDGTLVQIRTVRTRTEK